MSARPLLTGGVVIVAFALGLFLARGLLRESDPPVLQHATLYPEPRPLPEQGLLDQDGRPFNLRQLAGHWTVVFFGFTQCPDVCPTTLATLARMRAGLTELPEADKPRVLLVSIDPERDTPDRLGAYVRHFDPSFLGVTGDPAAIATVAQVFGMPYARVATSADSYTMDHGTGVFFVGPAAAIVAYSSAPHDATLLARDFRQTVAWTGRQR